MKIQDIKITFNTMCEFEKCTNKSLFDVIKSKKLGLNDIRAIIKGALDIEEDEAGKLIEEYIQEHGFEKFTELFNEKINEFYNNFDKKK